MEFLCVNNLKKMPQGKLTAGFTILEMAIVISIMSILIVIGLNGLDASNQRQSYEITLERQKQIQEAITLFVITNGRLPCPASPAQSQYNQTYGYEQTSGGVCATLANSYISSYNSTYQGAIPIRSLSLAEEYMFDGWGNRFGYAVQNDMTAAASNNMEVRDGRSGGSNPYGNLIANDVQYVLISYGKNGYGAFRRSADIDLDGTGAGGGATLRNLLPSDALQLRNSGSTMGVEYVQNALGDGLSGFDDLLVFKTHNQIVYECNKGSVFWNQDTPSSSCSSMALR